ncbi:hypothetical protein HY389_01440 [Candidatus Daviesbacteria bacterium]|nr:hypothetical protein [Candidatus Daviesbacteria bacterium]
MSTFIPISILGYALNAGSIIVAKIQIREDLKNPIVYTFYANILQLLILGLVPFGFTFHPSQMAIYYGLAAGIEGVLALHVFYISLQLNEASVVGPVVGALNPLFTLPLALIFSSLALTGNQFTAALVLISGGAVLTANIWFSKSHLNPKILWMVAAGALFALNSVLTREMFLHSTFIDGLVISRATSGFIAVAFLALPELRRQLISKNQAVGLNSRSIILILVLGQILGGVAGLLLSYGVFLANPALVNSLFGVQFLVILIFALFLKAEHHQRLLGEQLNRRVIIQKTIGAIVLSYGLYLLLK